MSPDNLQELAGRHGLIAEPGSGGVFFIRRDPGPSSRYALRQEQPGLPLMNRPGRIIPAGRADAYLAAWTASPDEDADHLYAQAIPDTGSPPADEHACPREVSHSACSDASCRARDTGRDHYLYVDGRAAVTAARPPVAAAYYAVSPAGEWTRHLDGAAEAIDRPPNAQALSSISGETAAARTEPGTPPGPADWTAGHPYTAQIAAMRDAATANTRIIDACGSDVQNFAITFAAWARTYLATTATAHLGATGTDPPEWARAFLDDHSLTADLTATLAAQVRQQLAGGPAPAPESPSDDAVTAAAQGWRRHAEQTRSAALGCAPGCDQCTLSADAGPGLSLATAIDIHLARAGIPHSRRGVIWDEEARHVGRRNH